MPTVRKINVCSCCGQEIRPLTSQGVIELYYRSKAAGSKITLQKLADQYGLAVGALKTAKRRYDAAGKWGSKAVKEYA
jgi:hypothetical protein